MQTELTDAEREDIRAARQAEVDMKVEKLRARAARLEAEATRKMADFNKYRQDIAWLTQPANPNSSFGRSRSRVVDRYDAGMRLSLEASKLREQADWIEKQGVRVKGDAERKRAAIAAKLDTMITTGSRVHDFCFGYGIVTRVNKKTYTIKWERSGSQWTREKHFVRPVKTEVSN